MATQNFLFTGITKWAKVRKPDELYNNYQVPLYMDEESFKKFKESGCQLTIKEDLDGKFVVFKRKHTEIFKGKSEELGPPPVKIRKLDGTIEDWPEGLIGNGSKLTVQISIYDTRNGKGHRIQGVIVEDLVVFERPDDNDKFEMPF